MDNHHRATFRQIAATNGECLDYDDWKFLNEICQELLKRRGFTVIWPNDLEEAIMIPPGELNLQEILREKIGEEEINKLSFRKVGVGIEFSRHGEIGTLSEMSVIDETIEKPKPGAFYLSFWKRPDEAGNDESLLEDDDDE